MGVSTHPSVLIIGRTNVGKSTLFNRLSRDAKSIVFDREGVTRDFLAGNVDWKGRQFTLFDTGGMSTKKTVDPLECAVQKKLKSLLDAASAVLFVCDGTVGITHQDRIIAKMLHRHGVCTIVAVNKTDNKRLYDEHRYEFDQFGFSSVIPISAEHGIGTDDILESVTNMLPEKVYSIQKKSPMCRVVLLGKPNVGKSSLMNLLLREERTIVADKPGTTRESVVDYVKFYQQDIQLVDTAGIRKKRSVTDPLEKLMVKNSLHMVRDADIVLLLTDASEGTISDQELKLAYYIIEQQHKGLILLLNKYDLVKDDSYLQDRMAHSLDAHQELLKKVERLSISCKSGYHLGKVLQVVEKIWKRLQQTFTDDELTFFFKECLQKRPLYKRQQLLKIRRARQVKTLPITIVISTNSPKLFDDSHLKFFENKMRKAFNLRSVPTKFLVR